MVCALSTGFGDVEHHQHAMATSAGLDFAQRSGQYPPQSGQDSGKGQIAGLADGDNDLAAGSS
jgi:hypothetical protein